MTKTMKKLLTSIAIALAMVMPATITTGCKSAPKAAYQTTSITYTTATSAMGAWDFYVQQFHPPVATELRVKAAYEKYQAAMIVCADAGYAYTLGTGSQGSVDAAIAAAAASLTDLVSLLQEFGINLATK